MRGVYVSVCRGEPQLRNIIMREYTGRMSLKQLVYNQVERTDITPVKSGTRHISTIGTRAIPLCKDS